MLPLAWQLRLLHICDVVIALDTISDASPVYKLLPDPARCGLGGAWGRVHTLLKPSYAKGWGLLVGELCSSYNDVVLSHT